MGEKMTAAVYYAGIAVMLRLLNVEGDIEIGLEDDGEHLCISYPAWAFAPPELRHRLGLRLLRGEPVPELKETVGDRLLRAAGRAACLLAVERGIIPDSPGHWEEIEAICVEPLSEDVSGAKHVLAPVWPHVVTLAERVCNAVRSAPHVLTLKAGDAPLAALLRQEWAEKMGTEPWSKEVGR